MSLIKNEQELFNYLKKNVVEDLTKAEDEFSVYDCYSISQKTIIELKARGEHYDTLLIEKKKYDALMKFDCNVRYICSTPKGIFSFDLKSLKNIQWVAESHNKTTEFKNNNKVSKLIYNIPINKSVTLN
jgi:hypothetical protein